MEVIGIICEYNPFHNGHLYHLETIRKLYPDALIILVLNGYFLERGEISIQAKEDKINLALEYSIDIVLELPFLFGTQSADTFATTALKILNNFGINRLVFGSECNDITKLKKIAKKQREPKFDENVLKYLKTGLNYPTSIIKALDIDFDFNPNDLLGISYIKAIYENNYNIEPVTIKRTSHYHDTSCNDRIISASNIRAKLNNNEDISHYVPVSSYEKIKNINIDLLFQILKSKIITDDNLNSYLDVDEGIEFRLKEKIITCNNLNEFIKAIQTKRYTYNKIRRMLIHILIGLKKEDAKSPLEYIKVLGFNQKGKEYLNAHKKEFKITTSINKNSLIFAYELKAALIYDLICKTNTYQFEKNAKPILKTI